MAADNRHGTRGIWMVLGYSHFQLGKQYFLPSSYNSQLSGQEFHYTFDGWKSCKQMPVAFILIGTIFL